MYSSQNIVAACVAVTIVYVFLNLIRKACLSPLSKLPGPWHAHLTNLRLKASTMSGDRSTYIHSLHVRYGPIVRISPDEVSCTSVESFQMIHKVGTKFVKSPFYQSMTTSPELDKHFGVFNMTNQKQHAQRRKMFSRSFSQNYLRDRWESTVREKVELAVSRMREERVRLGKTDALKWWMLMASDVSAHLMFGDSFHGLESGEKAEYLKTIDLAMMGLSFRWELPPIYWLGSLIPHQSFRRIFRGNEILCEKGEEAIVNSRSSSQSTNIFATIISEAEKGEETLTDADVAVEAANLLLAGSDTTANTMTYLTWAVISHPQTQLALQDELAPLDDPLTDAILEKLPILNAVIEETLRLYGAAPGTLPRTVPQGGVMMDGYFVPEGTTVGTQAYSLHRDPAYFSNPYSFDFTRWLPPNRLSDPAKAVYSPFGAGSRVCLGVHLAKMELRLATARFFRECKGARLAPSTTPESMEMENFFLIAPKSHRCEIVI